MTARARTAQALAALVLVLSPVAAPPAPAAAQGQPLTIHRIFNDPALRLQGLPALQWMDDGRRFTYVVSEGSATHLVSEDARTGEKSILVDGRRLVPAGAQAPIEIEDYEFSEDETKLLIFTDAQQVWRQATKGRYYVLDLASGALTPVSRAPGWQMFAKLSPDASKVGFVRDNDIFVTDLATGAETRLTADGSEEIINGTFDWVYEEELDLRDGWRWSPDGRRIAFWQIDQSPVRTFTMVNETDSVYSRTIPLRYPKAGDANPIARVGVVELATGARTWIDTGSDPSVYLARMEWAGTPDALIVQRLNRHQNRLDVMRADARTGEARVLFTDTDSAWVEVDNEWAVLEGGRRILFTSERDGFNHLYLFDGQTGRLVRQLTRGPWEVTDVEDVDERSGYVYFTATEEGPTQKHLYRVPLRGGAVRQLSAEPGTHSMALSPGSPFYIDTWSRAGVPPVYRLHTTEGEVVRVLEDNARARQALEEAGARKPEFFSFTTPEGTELNGWMIKPAGFDPTKKYPVLLYVYGGPGSQTVTDAWGNGTRYLWHQTLAQDGYVVASVDNRGTGGRGAAFKKSTYLALGDKETQDQVAAGRHFASLPWVDAERIGIWGWSYGGYVSSLTMMRPGHPFAAGIAVAPVADWDLYDTIYTERFLRTPQENPAGYRDNAPTEQAAKLEGDLLIVHGTADDNVHFQNTVQLVDALQEAGKQFDVMIYPDRNHSISGGRSEHLYTYMTRWLKRSL